SVTSCYRHLLRRSPRSVLFPYTTLFRSVLTEQRGEEIGTQLLECSPQVRPGATSRVTGRLRGTVEHFDRLDRLEEHVGGDLAFGDRKSTRLNSSHVKISYAVFCLKKKKI